MQRALRENAVCAFAAFAGCAMLAWLGLYGFAWNDYDNEARPALDALVHGHLSQFIALSPAYGGSLVERAPFALAAHLAGGGELALYRAVALPCLLAAAALGVWLVSRMRARGAPRLARAVALGVCVVNPVTLRALELGHPEELLGACMCVAAVMLAARGRWLAAGVVLGLAIANKEWALLAAAPVLLALAPRVRLRALALCAVTAGAVLAPLALASGGFATRAGAVASPTTGAIFQPWQLFWFFGHHGALVHGLYGAAKPAYRIGPGWISAVSHPLILAAGFAVALGAWLAASRRPRAGADAAPTSPAASQAAIGTAREPRGAPEVLTRLRRLRTTRLSAQQALLALALALLLRCVLDTWDTAYYALPFLLALLAWEVALDSERPPVLALAASILVWVSFQWLPEHVTPDAQAALFLAWTLPLSALLATLLLAGPRAARAQTGSGRRERRLAQERTVSSLGRLVSTSAPSSATTTRSSIRTPSSPGR